MGDTDDIRLTGRGILGQHARLNLLERVLSDGSMLHGALDLITDSAVQALEVPVVLVSLVGRERQHFVGQTGMADEHRAGTPISHSFCQHVVIQGEALVIDHAEEHPLVCENPAIRDLGVMAYAGQPIVVDGQTLGSLCAIDSVPRSWSAREVAALRAFADLVEYLIDARLTTVGQLVDQRANAGSRERQQTARLAVYEAVANEQDQVQALNRRLQHALLPLPDSTSALAVDVFYRPGSDRLLLGGDFVDTAHVGDRGLNFIVGDVTGHGPEAAALAISLRSAWHALQSVGVPLEQLVAVLDEQTAASSLYATMVVGSVTVDGQLKLISAGHPTPIAAGERGVHELTEHPGPMLGMGLGGARWPIAEHDVAGQTLILYTDGLVEGRIHGTRERFGTERLLAAIADLGPDPERLCEAAAELSGGPLPDDVAILKIEPVR